MFIYAPVVKGKENDLIGLGQLDINSIDKIKPLIEFIPSRKEDSVIDTQLYNFSDYLIKNLPLGEIFLDFRGLKPEVKTTQGTNATLAGFNLIKLRGRKYTPVFGFGRAEDKEVENYIWENLQEFINYNKKGFCFRLEMDDLEDAAQNTWLSIIEQTSKLNLGPSEIDIYIDLRHIGEKPISALISALVDFLSLNPNIRSYRSIIVSGSSALKEVGKVPKDGMQSVHRNELFVWSELVRDLPDDILVTFGDYGVIHPEISESSSGGSSNMNGKIRYTAKSKIHYFRGHVLYPKGQPKDLKQYHDIAKRVVESGHFIPQLSLGDVFLEKVAERKVIITSPNELIHSDLNHHFQYTISQLEKLIPKIKYAENMHELIDIS